MLRTMTMKFYCNNAKSESVEYEVMNEQRRSATVVHRSLFLQLLALSSAASSGTLDVRQCR